jgi:hypothetical protein
MVERRTLVKLRRALRSGPASTVAIARVCGWSIEQADAELEALVVAGNVAREPSESGVLWRAIDLSAANSATQPLSPPETTNPYAPSQAAESPSAHEEDGNFWLGLFAGFFGGLLVVALFAALGRPATRRGTHWGLCVQVGIVVLVLLFR